MMSSHAIHDSAATAGHSAGGLALRPSQPEWPAHGLVSLWDMMRIRLEHYVTIGANMATLRRMIAENGRGASGHTVRLGQLDVSQATMAVVGQLREACAALGLRFATATIDRTMQGITHLSQVDCLMHAVEAELTTRLFLSVPDDRARFYECTASLTDDAGAVFPASAAEVRAASTAYACGLWNASVFHAMRAAEKVLLAICEDIGVTVSGVEQWGTLIERIEARLAEIVKMPKSSFDKRVYLQPLSEQVVDLRLFKDAWRNQMVHGVVAYNDGQALVILEAVCRVMNEVARWRARPSGVSP